MSTDGELELSDFEKPKTSLGETNIITEKQIYEPFILTQSGNEQSLLRWHCSVGHACFHTLSLINSEGLPKFKTEGIQCQQCLQGRQTRNSISKESTTRSSKRLDLTHINLCGPLSVASLSGTRYFILLVDD